MLNLTNLSILILFFSIIALANIVIRLRVQNKFKLSSLTNTDLVGNSSNDISLNDLSDGNHLNHTDQAKYIKDVEKTVNYLGFKLSNMGRIHLQHLCIDRNFIDMALSLVLPAIADDYYTGRNLLSLSNGALFLISPIRNLLDRKMIHDSVFELSVKIIDCATDANYNDSTSFLLEIRANNYFAKNVNSNQIICYPDIKNSPHYHDMNNIMKELYNEYLKTFN